MKQQTITAYKDQDKSEMLEKSYAEKFSPNVTSYKPMSINKLTASQKLTQNFNKQ